MPNLVYDNTFDESGLDGKQPQSWDNYVSPYFKNIRTLLNTTGLDAVNLGVTAGQVTASKALVVDASRNLADGTAGNQINNLTLSGTFTCGTVSITGGSVSGITDLAVADGGTGASTASAARTNLGLVIGSDVQAYDAELQALSGLTPTDGNFIVGNGSTFVTEDAATSRTSLGLGSIATQASNNVTITGGSVTGIVDVTVADGGTGASDAAGARTNLGLVIGTNVQAYDAGLADIAGLATSDGNVIVGSGSNWVAESGATARTSLGLGSIATQASDSVSITGGSVTGITDITVADGGTGASNASGARTNLGVAIGSDVQAYDAGLADIAALATTDGNIIVGSGSNWVAESGATARTSLGLGSIATQAADNVSISGGSLTGMTSYSGGTISGTTGTFSSTLAVDTDTLYVDVTNDRVGINNNCSTVANFIVKASMNGIHPQKIENAAGQSIQETYIDGSGNGSLALRNASGFQRVQLSTYENSYITAGYNFGLGTSSPAYQLESSTSSTSISYPLALTNSDNSTNASGVGIVGRLGRTTDSAVYSFAMMALVKDGTWTGSPPTNIDGHLRFYTVEDESSVERLRITNATTFFYGGEASFGADSNNRGIVNYGSNVLALSTVQGGTTYYDTVKITDSNVGIGVSPTQKLHVAGDVLIDTGTTSTLYFDANTNWMQLISGDFRWGLASTEYMRLDSSGNLKLQNTSTNSNPFFQIKNDAREYNLQVAGARSDNFEIYDNTAGTQRLTILSDGKTGIGTASPRCVLNLDGNESTAVTFGVDNTSGGGTLDISCLGSTYTAHGAAPGEVWFYSPDNINIGGATGGTNDIKFLGGGNEKARIRTSGGITFNGDTADANALDDYEEGTWTPSLQSGEGSLSVYSARYTKIGNKVTVACYLYNISPTNNSTTFKIEGLPYPTSNSSGFYHSGQIGYSGTGQMDDMGLIGEKGQSRFYFHFLNSGNSGAAVRNDQFVSRSITTFIVQLTYTTD